MADGRGSFEPILLVAGAVAGVYELIKYVAGVSEVPDIQAPIATFVSAPVPETDLTKSIVDASGSAADTTYPCFLWLGEAYLCLSHFPWPWVILAVLGMSLVGIVWFSWILAGQFHAEKESEYTASLAGTAASHPEQSVRDITSSSHDPLEKANSELRAELESTSQELVQAEARHELTKAKLQEAEKQIADYWNEIAEQENEAMESLDKELVQSNQQVQKLTKQLAGARCALFEAQTTRDDYASIVMNADYEKGQAQSRADRAEARAEALQSEIQCHKEKLNDTLDELKDVKADFVDTNNDYNQVVLDAEGLQDQIASLEYLLSQECVCKRGGAPDEDGDDDLDPDDDTDATGLDDATSLPQDDIIEGGGSDSADGSSDELPAKPKHRHRAGKKRGKHSNQQEEAATGPTPPRDPPKDTTALNRAKKAKRKARKARWCEEEEAKRSFQGGA